LLRHPLLRAALAALLFCLFVTSTATAMPPRKHHHTRRHDVGVHPAGERAIAFAWRMRGVPYSYGGASRSGVDCSGLVMLAWRAAGVSLPHSSYAQWSAGRHVPRRALRPGDVVFFDGRGHVGLYLGHGRFIHAPHTGTYVRVDRLGAAGYGDRYDGAVRP
jgi:cell wall-associated NlpC family hydrolase